MEKSLKLTNSFLMEDINFDGFSSSSGWVGYIEKKGNFDFKKIDEVVFLFKNYFIFEENFFLLTALSYSDERIGGH